jgi:hypothetical protein
MVYLLYTDDGATLVYAGLDAAEYDRLSRKLAAGHAGSLIGRRRTGRTEQWVVRAFFRERPSPAFIASRRHGFPYGLEWEPATGMEQAADGC